MKIENLKNNYKKILFVFCPIVAVLLTADLLTKYYVNKFVELGDSTSFLPGFIRLTNVHNDGAAWSTFAGNQIFLIIISFIFISLLTFLYFRELKNGALFHISFALIFVGALGNLIDRLCFGYVRDMLHFEFLLSFPVFNVADMCVCVGVFLTVLYYLILLTKKREKDGRKV